MPINGGGCATATWTVAAKRAGADWSSAAHKRSGIRPSPYAACCTRSARETMCSGGYHDTTFERFWKRELDIEDPGVVGGVLAEAGADIAKFADYAAGPGRMEIDGVCHAAEAIGVFGVPSFVLDGELFWGREHLPISARCSASVAGAPITSSAGNRTDRQWRQRYRAVERPGRRPRAPRSS
jgi:hypothetical protein